MALLEELRGLGSNVDEGLERFMGNMALYERMLRKLPDMVRKTDVEGAFASGELKEAEERAHALKGATGNLSVTPLYEGYTKVVDLLRAGQANEAKAVYDGMVSIQEQIIACIERGE